MTVNSDPVDLIDGLTSDADTDNVSKSETRAELKALLRYFGSADDVRNTDLSGRNAIFIGAYPYIKDTASIVPDSGGDTPTALIDGAGNHWIVQADALFSGIISRSGTNLTIQPATGLNKGLLIEQTASGAPSLDGGVNGFGWGFNIIRAVDAGIDTSALSAGSQNSAALYVEYKAQGSTGVKGNLAAIYGAFELVTAPATTNPLLLNFLAGQFIAQGAVNAGGSSGTKLGAVFGMGASALLSNGATYYQNLTGGEVNSAIQTGASSDRYSVLSLAPHSTHAVSGIAYDTVLSISNMSSFGVGHGILFSDYNGHFAVGASGTLIGTQGSSTVNIGIDISSFTFTGAALVLPGFKVYGSGLPHVKPAQSLTSGGSTDMGLWLSSATAFGIFAGQGAPTISASKGSLYLRSDGSGTSDRSYINTDGGTTWTALSTAA